MALRFRGELEVPILEQTLGEILQRHEVLRTTFPAEEGIPSQVITGVGPVCLPLHDLSEFSAIERESQAIQRARLEIKRPFDLAQGPLLRVLLLRLDDEEHILFLFTHQIVFDGWSARILIKEMAAIYDAFASGNRSPLVELPIQYGDFAYWQRQSFQEEIFQAQLSYWKEKLRYHSPELDLPTDRTRPAIQTYSGSRQSLLLDPSLLTSLRTLGKREGVTLFMVLLAAFQTLLHRYTGQEDILVGSPIAGRTRVETEGMIGPFINTLVLRIDLSGNPSFLELLQRVRSMTLDAYMNQDLPFERLVKELRPDRDLSRPPFFQVMFNLENLPQKVTDIRNLEIEEFEFDSGTTHFDLEFEIIDNRQGFSCLMSYNRDLFDSPTINRLLGHYQTLLQGLANHPDQHLSELPLLTESERRQILVDWNDTFADYPSESCIHELFEAQVAHTPDRTAIVFEGEELTYRELNHRANQLGHYLQKLGVGPEVFVGLFVDRSLEMIVGLLGILKAGGAYVPIDPGYPQGRVAFMLQDAQIQTLLTHKRLLEGFPENKANAICLDIDWEVIAQESGENPFSGVKSDNAAYVIYTSGSTGTPKGVIGLHRGAVNRFNWMWKTYPFETEEICCQKTSLSFVDSIGEILGPLLRGVRTVIIPDIVLKDPQAFVRKLAANQVTRIVLVPSLLRIIMENFPELQSHLPNLKIWITSGETLSSDLAQQFQKSMPGRILINLYGSSEVSADSTCYNVTKAKLDSCTSIGRPIDNTQIYLLDPNLNPVPIGVRGELHIGGEGLARGYLNRPDLTKERFIENAFGNEPGSRLYKTGDLARYLPDGNLEFLGRLDHQVKIRGCRIELGEIETILGQHFDVRETVVKEYGAEAGDARLVAYVVSERRPSSLIAELRQFLQTKLPEYMIPSYFVVLECLPMLPNGKVDRRALPPPEAARPLLETSFVAPRDVLESQLTKMWEEILDIRPIGVRDNFFHLGGHSLLAARVCARIGKILGKPFPLIKLFQSPTIEQMARVLALEEKKTDDRSLILIQGAGSGRPFFCVPGNVGNVFADLGDLAHRIGSDRPFYGFQDSIHNPTQIEAVAARYIKEMRVAQPEGPYFLGGICLGGVVAFEMAQQLQELGQDIGLLLLVEPGRPPVKGLQATLRLLFSILYQAARKFGSYLWKFLSSETAERVTYAQLRAKLVANLWAQRRYVPKPYRGKLVLLLSEESLTGNPRSDKRVDWRKVPTAGTEVHFIPGTHEAITQAPSSRLKESDFKVLAEKMKLCIEKASSNDSIK